LSVDARHNLEQLPPIDEGEEASQNSRLKSPEALSAATRKDRESTTYSMPSRRPLVYTLPPLLSDAARVRMAMPSRRRSQSKEQRIRLRQPRQINPLRPEETPLGPLLLRHSPLLRTTAVLLEKWRRSPTSVDFFASGRGGGDVGFAEAAFATGERVVLFVGGGVVFGGLLGGLADALCCRGKLGWRGGRFGESEVLRRRRWSKCRRG